MRPDPIGQSVIHDTYRAQNARKASIKIVARRQERHGQRSKSHRKFEQSVP